MANRWWLAGAVALLAGAMPAWAETPGPQAPTEADADAALGAGYYAQAAVTRLKLFERSKEPVHLERAGRAFLAVGSAEACREAARVLRQYLGLEQDPAKRAEAERLLAQAEAGPPARQPVPLGPSAPPSPGAAGLPAAPAVPGAAPPYPGRPLAPGSAAANGAPPYYYAPGYGWVPWYGPIRPPAPPKEPETEMNSPGAVAVGAVLAGGGLIALAGGLISYVTTSAYYECQSYDADYQQCRDKEKSGQTGSIVAAVAGGVGMLLGGGLIFYGAWQVTPEPKAEAPAASAAPRVSLGLGAARLGWRF